MFSGCVPGNDWTNLEIALLAQQQLKDWDVIAKITHSCLSWLPQR